MRVDPAKLALSVDFLKFLPLTPRLGVAVSGGSDSMALLHLLALATQEAGIDLHVATVNHGLRAEAAQEAAFVAGVCDRLNVSHDTLRWTGWDGQGNLQAQAREARYRLLAEWAKSRDIHNVALGHTADDLAETMIMRLARGAGVDGLTGMVDPTRKHGVPFFRPMLRLRRDDLRDHLKDLGESWCDDPSNEDTRYDRIRIRKAMEAFESVGVTPDALSLVAENMRSAHEALRSDARTHALACTTSVRGDVVVDDRAFLDLNFEQARRILSAALGWVSGQVYAPRREVQIKLLQAVRHRKHATASGCLIVPEAGGVRICRELNAVKGAVGPTTDVWDGRWRLTGPHSPDQQVRALGEAGILHCPDWRETGLPRASLLASPAVWKGDTLIAAPVAGNSNGWDAHIVTDFHDWMLSH